MKKRLISLLMSVVMMIGLLPVITAAAGDTALLSLPDGGWYVKHEVSSRHEGERSVWTATGVSQDGDNKSLYVNYKSYKKSETSLSHADIYNTGIAASDIKAGTYHISFWLKGDVYNFSVLLNGWTDTYRKYATTKNELTTLADWTKYEFDIAVDTPSDVGFRMIAETDGTATNQFYLDNVSVTYNDDATNLLNNPSFAGYEVSAPAETADLYKWKAVPKGGETTAVAKTAKGVSYSGDNSMYIKYAASDYDSQWMTITNDDFTTYDAAPYTLEFYAKGNFSNNEGSTIRMSMGGSTSTFTPTSNSGKGQWKICHMTVTDLPDTDPKKTEGWRKYSATFESISEAFKIVVQSTCELYIDDMSIKASGSDVNLFGNPGFEEEKSYIGEVDDPAEGTLSDVGAGWKVTADADSPLDGITNIVKETTHTAYEGEKSLYVKYSPVNKDDNGDCLRIENLGFAQAEPDKQYRVSFYLKGDYAYKGENYYNDVAFNVALGWAMNETRIRMSKQTSYTPEEAEKAAEGWEKYSFEINTADKAQKDLTSFSLFIMNDCEMYLDNFAVEEKISEGVYSANLLTNSGFEGIVEYPVLCDLENWTVTPAGTGEISVKTATGVSYSGNNSMYVKTADGGNYTFVYNSAWPTAKTDDTDKVYNIEFYAKGSYEKTETASDPFFVMVGWGWGWGIKKMTESKHCTVSTPEDAAKASEGWKKYTCELDVNHAKTTYETNNPGKTYSPTPFQLGFAGNCDLYVDDVKVTIKDGDGVNLMANPGFEGASDGSLKIVGTRLFDAEDNAIANISGQGGKEVTTLAYAINNTDAPKTAQIITCLYDGNIMIDSTLSPVISIPNGGEAVLMKGVMKLPTAIESDYELRVYLWDSLTGMIPLKRTVDVY